MRTKTFVWLALCFITALSVGLMILAIFYYDYEQFDKSNDFEDDSVKMIKKSENSFILFYSLEDPNFGFQNSWQSFRMKIQDWNNTNVVYVGKIECSVFRSTCNSFKVDRYPTIAWIKNGKVVEEYVGDDISESIKKFFDKLVMIVTEQKPTTVQSVTSSVKIVQSTDILQGGSFDIIRRFFENEKVQDKNSTVYAKPTEASTTINYDNFNARTETSKQYPSNSSTTHFFEVENSTQTSNTSNKEQILITTTENINSTEKVEQSTNRTNNIPQESTETTTLKVTAIPVETFSSSLSIPDYAVQQSKNQTNMSTPAMPEHSSSEISTTLKNQTTTIDESSSESIIMTRPTESSEQENVESNKNESYEDESPEDDDTFGLGSLFGNTDGNNAEYEDESEGDENNEDAQKSEENSKIQESKTLKKSGTRWDQEKKESTKSVSKSKEYKKKPIQESKDQDSKKDMNTKVRSTTKKSHYSEEKQKSKKESTTRKYDSESKEHKKKPEKESKPQKDYKTEIKSTTKSYEYSKEKETSKKYKSESRKYTKSYRHK